MQRFLIVIITISLAIGLLSAKEDRGVKDTLFTVVLDAGHGGKDPGNLGNGYREKDIALAIVLKIGSYLASNPQIRVIYTRQTDVFVELDQRARIANKANADLFISVHCDSHKSDAYGAGTFVLGLHENKRNFDIAKKENSVIFLEDDYQEKYDGFDPNSPESVISLVLMQEEYLNQSIQVADLIQQSFVSNLKRKDRTVKQAGFLVLRNTYMPSVLVETGFLTNKSEGAFLNSKDGQNKMAHAIADAIVSYKNKVLQNKGLDVWEKGPVLESEELPSTELVFKVQIAAGSRSLNTSPQNFKGLRGVTKEKENNLYRYYYGYTDSLNKAELLRTEAVKAGFKESFIVVYKNGKKIPLSEDM